MNKRGYGGRRVMLRYAASFAGGTLLALLAAYLALAGGLVWLDHSALNQKWRETALAWNKGGPAGVRRAVETKPGSARFPLAIVYVLSKTASPLYRYSAMDQDDAEAWGLSRIPPGGAIHEVTVMEDDAPLRMDALSAALPGGGTLVIGHISRRNEILGQARNAILAALLPLLALSALGGAFLIQRVMARQARTALDAVAHDLRTPLTRLSAGAETALAGPTNPEALRASLASCAEEASLMRSQIDSLLDLTEADSGGLALDIRPVDAGEAASGSAEIYRDLAEERGMTIGIKAESGIIVRADPARLRQMLANLFDNAVKYGREGTAIILSVKRAGRRVEFIMQDNGIGIPAEELPRVFDRRFRGRSTGGVPGLGLGLSLVRALARAQGGEATAGISPDGLTTFSLTLPGE